MAQSAAISPCADPLSFAKAESLCGKSCLHASESRVGSLRELTALRSWGCSTRGRETNPPRQLSRPRYVGSRAALADRGSVVGSRARWWGGGSRGSSADADDIAVRRVAVRKRKPALLGPAGLSPEEAAAAARALDVPVYDPELLVATYRRQPLRVYGRALSVLSALGSFGLGLLWDKQRGRLNDPRTVRRRAAALREQLSGLGPTFVKVGQALSTRPDLCPPEYLEELAYLQDALPTFSNQEAFACIEREIGAPLETLYSSITPKPIAAASLGQVYKAVTRGGQVVAVKVQRPGIAARISLDFYLLRNACQFVDTYVDAVTTPLVPLLDEFARRVYQELNYVQEARNAVRFEELYGDRPDVKVPGIYWDLTAARVLTMEWIDGTKLSEQDAITRQGLDVLSLVDTGIQCSLRQLLEHGYFHADPHPGNLLATPDGRLAFLDFGMMAETPATARYAIIGHVVHLVNRDYEAMARDYYDLDFLTPDVDVSPIVPALRGFFDDVLGLSVSELNFKTLIDGLGELYYQYPFNVPPYYALILRSLTVLEGLALYTDPNFKVLAAAYPYFAFRLLSADNPYLQNALIELLFNEGQFRWSRLENLLVEGRKDSEFSAGEIIPPLLELLLRPESDRLRALVEAEAIRVMEAMTLGAVLEGASRVPPSLAPLLPGTRVSVDGQLQVGFGMKPEEEANLILLRSQVRSVWRQLQASSSFNPNMLQPLLQVLQQQEVTSMGGRVAGGLMRRLAARALQQLLRPFPA